MLARNNEIDHLLLEIDIWLLRTSYYHGYHYANEPNLHKYYCWSNIYITTKFDKNRMIINSNITKLIINSSLNHFVAMETNGC